MNTLSPSEARTGFYPLLKKTLSTHLPTRIVSKNGTVLLITEDEYESLLETAELLAEPGLKKSLKVADKEIAEGRLYSIDDAFCE